METENIILAINSMLHELKRERLEVVLAKSPDRSKNPSSMIRVVQNQNPLWYQELCELYPKQEATQKNKTHTD